MADELMIECKLIRKGGSIVDLPGGPYHFKPGTDGAHVCAISDPDDIAALLGIKDGYRIYRPKVDVSDVAPVMQPEPAKEPAKDEKATAKTKAAKADAKATAAAHAPMGLDAKPTEEAMVAMSREQIAAIFEAEVGRAPSEVADVEVMIAQIVAKRAEA